MLRYCATLRPLGVSTIAPPCRVHDAARRCVATGTSAATPPPAATSAIGEPYLKVVGDATKGVRSTTFSTCVMSDVIGRQITTSDIGDRLLAGELLWMIDICAARAAARHVVGFYRPPQKTFANEARAFVSSAVPPPIAGDGDGAVSAKSSGALAEANVGASSRTAAHSTHPLSVATVAMDSVIFRHAVMPGDSIRLEGSVVSCGASSLAVNVHVSRLQFPTRQEQGVANATVFMVAIDQRLAAAKVVPAVGLCSPTHLAYHNHAEAAKSAQKLRREEAANIAVQTVFDLQKLDDGPNGRKRVRVPMWETEVTASRVFFQGEMNLNGTVFGGEILRWMEVHAVQCGRFFSGNRRVVTLGVHSMEFRYPIFHTDWTQLKAYVVYVRNSTLEVDVEVFVERNDGVFVTNVASFVLISLDEISRPLELQTGLDVTAIVFDDKNNADAASGRCTALNQPSTAAEPNNCVTALDVPPSSSSDNGRRRATGVVDVSAAQYAVQRKWLRKFAAAKQRYDASRAAKNSCLVI